MRMSIIHLGNRWEFPAIIGCLESSQNVGVYRYKYTSRDELSKERFAPAKTEGIPVHNPLTHSQSIYPQRELPYLKLTYPKLTHPNLIYPDLTHPDLTYLDLIFICEYLNVCVCACVRVHKYIYQCPDVRCTAIIMLLCCVASASRAKGKGILSLAPWYRYF